MGGEGEENQPPKKKTQLRAVTLRHGRREEGFGLREKKKKKGISACPALLRQQEQTANPVDFFFFPTSAFLFQHKDFHSGKKPQTTRKQNKTSELNTRKSKTNNEQSC